MLLVASSAFLHYSVQHLCDCLKPGLWMGGGGEIDIQRHKKADDSHRNGSEEIFIEKGNAGI